MGQGFSRQLGTHIHSVQDASWQFEESIISCGFKEKNRPIIFELSIYFKDPILKDFEQKTQDYLRSESENVNFLFGPPPQHTVIPAPKKLLMSRSLYFRTMFEREAQLGNVHIQNGVQVPDIMPSTFRKILNFFYTGKCEVDTSTYFKSFSICLWQRINI